MQIELLIATDDDFIFSPKYRLLCAFFFERGWVGWRFSAAPGLWKA